MDQIQVNVSVLEEKIAALQQLRVKCAMESCQIETVAGSGESIAVIGEINQEYELLRQALETWVVNSIAFFENAKDSMVNTDEAVADSFS